MILILSHSFKVLELRFSDYWVVKLILGQRCTGSDYSLIIIRLASSMVGYVRCHLRGTRFDPGSIQHVCTRNAFSVDDRNFVDFLLLNYFLFKLRKTFVSFCITKQNVQILVYLPKPMRIKLVSLRK
jgi:hypothetical protein